MEYVKITVNFSDNMFLKLLLKENSSSLGNNYVCKVIKYLTVLINKFYFVRYLLLEIRTLMFLMNLIRYSQFYLPVRLKSTAH